MDRQPSQCVEVLDPDFGCATCFSVSRDILTSICSRRRSNSKKEHQASVPISGSFFGGDFLANSLPHGGRRVHVPSTFCPPEEALLAQSLILLRPNYET